MSLNSVIDNGCMLDKLLIEYQIKLGIAVIDKTWKFGLGLNNIINNYNNKLLAGSLNIDNFLCLTAGFLFSNNNILKISLTEFRNNWVFNYNLPSSSLIISQSLYFQANSNNTINWNLQNLTFIYHTGFWNNNITKNFIGPYFTSGNIGNDFMLGGRNSLIHFNLISDSFKGVINLQYLNMTNNSFYSNGMLISSRFINFNI